VILMATILHREAGTEMKKLLLTGIAALFLATGTAHATEHLPEAMLGNWCWFEGGDEQNWNQQIFARVPPDGCHGGDSLIRIDQLGIEGSEGSCTFGKIEQQTGPNAFLIYTYCGDDTNGSTRFEIIDGKLVITALSVG
jgi:hypothetical protein